MAEERVQRRLAAILAADVVGYSRLIRTDETGTRARFNAHFDDLIAPKVEEHHGRIFNTSGDGLLAEFGSVVNAVQCAVEFQRGMAERNRDADQETRMDFRIGLHLGDVIVEGEDIHGDGVNVAARLEGLAEPGGICVSANVYDAAEGKRSVGFEDLGEQEVKNIDRPIRAYRVHLESTAANPVVQRPDTPPALPDKPSIAVLPFQNMSDDPEQEYFSDGITEDIITALSHIRQIFVIARNTTFTYKGQAVEVPAIARELGVRYVQEGSVMKAGNRVRVTAQLIDGESGNHIWADRYDRDLEDMFEVQDDITRTVVGSIEPELTRAEFERVRSNPPESLDAWALFHRAIQHYARWSREENLLARQLFERAVELDGNFARAYAGISLTYTQGALLGISSFDREQAFRTAKRAVRLDEKDGFSHLALGRAHYHAREREEAVNELELTVTLNPSSAIAQSDLGLAYLASGDAEKSLVHMELSVRLSPADPQIGVFTSRLAAAYMALRNYQRAIECARKALPLIDVWPLRMYLTAALAHSGQVDRAAEEALKLKEIEPRISIAFVSEHLPLGAANLAQIFEGLRKAGIPER